jgi:hypothetical protein
MDTRTGLPNSLEELRNLVNSTADAYFLSWLWARWLEMGIDRQVLEAAGLLHLAPEDLQEKLLASQSGVHRELSFEVEQFLLRSLLREWGALVENYLERSGILAARGKQWSRLPPPVQVLRILRNSLIHAWTVGKVHNDVEWQSGPYRLHFYANQEPGSAAPAGYRENDEILPLLATLSGDAVRFLMMDVGRALESLDPPLTAADQNPSTEEKPYETSAPPWGQDRDRHAASRLIHSWLEDGADEQARALDFLRNALNADRLSDRPRFAQ